jgi:hypothetical protein
MSPYLEILGDEEQIGGRGTATKLYLEGLSRAKAGGLGWQSDSILSDASYKMYERLRNLGVPFSEATVGPKYSISAADLANVDIGRMQSNWLGRQSPSPLEGTLDMSQAARMQTEYELAHEVAQRNAALPVEQGGLGLPLNNTAMDRAKAMGFDTPAYHGGTNDFLEFKSNNPTYASDRAEIANIYAEATGRHRGLREINASPNVMPLLLGGKKLTVSDLGRGIGDNIYDILSHGYYPDNLAKLLNETPRRRLVNDIKNYGYDRVEVTDILDLGGEQMQHMIPSGSNQIRSRFAAFDPAKRGSANLMAGAAGATIGLSALRNIQRDEQPQPD